MKKVAFFILIISLFILPLNAFAETTSIHTHNWKSIKIDTKCGADYYFIDVFQISWDKYIHYYDDDGIFLYERFDKHVEDKIELKRVDRCFFPE
ncbi:hypothetical protein VQL36_13400 [Chengkuizengella sp. SCS-71B]|uniref:hypothetical protein n=1 Tax=Chengkuizengella sp. SCS-71B TaxID=3115290 RepID=UPI0032C22C01